MSSPDPPSPAGFVGRGDELSRLRALVASVREEDRGRAALVTGPAGVGKSRLMAELKRELRGQGETVIEGWCRRSDHRPHGPLVDLLGEAAALLADLGRPAPRTERALAMIAGLAAPPDADPGRGDRTLQFFETIRQALVELSEVHPPVVFVHDLHRADAAGLGLARYLLENLLTDPAFDWTPGGMDDPAPALLAGQAFRGLLVVSFRETPETRPLLEAARSSVAVTHVPLAGLDAEGVRAFLQSPAVIERLLRASEGLPLALEQLLDAIPDDPGAIWPHRLEAVEPAARPLLDVLACYRDPCTPEQLRDMAGVEADVRPLLAALVEARVLARAIERGVVRFRFADPAALAAYDATLNPARRAAVHRRVAERLALAGGLGVEPEEIAHHFIAGGVPAEAVPYALAAADRLQAAYSIARAAELLERVVDVAEGELHADILDRLAGLYAAAGDLERARRALERLVAAFPRRAGPALDARLASLLARVGDHEKVLALATAALEDDAPPEVQRRLVALAAEAAYQRGDPTTAERWCHALDGSAVLDVQALALRNTLGKVHLMREALDEAQALFARNLADSRALGDAEHQARALINLGVVELQRGAPDAALGRFEEAHGLSASRGDLRNLALSVENLAVLYHRRQAFGRALAYYHQSTAAFRQLGHRAQLATTALNLADLYLTVGDVDRARRLADIAAELLRRGRLTYLEAQALMLEGDLARAEGDLPRAAGRYEAARELIDGGGGNNQRLGPLLWAQAELMLEMDAPERAAPLLDEAAALPVGQDDAFSARLRATRGALLVARGQPRKALVELEAALNLAEQADDRETVWLVLSRLAEAHWALHDRSATLQALAGAADAIEHNAAALPRALRRAYVEAPGRQAVRDALRRVRAGIAPRGTLGPPPAEEATRLAREGGEYQHRWADRYPHIIGRDPALYPLFNSLDRVSGSDSMVLIRGESGTGKELVASALHAHSPRADGPFVKVNCAAFVETLLLSELFGHEKGAFTGAIASKKGRFELADGGTIFLDEIGDISPNTQVALLRVLQEGTFERVGGAETRQVDVRVICATHRDLEQMVRERAFRADLYYRLRGVVIELPALRERRSDIPLLVDHFLRQRAQSRPQRLSFSRAALASLVQHDWPGNVRELENVVRSVALFADGDTIGLTELAELGDIFRPPDEQALLQLSEMLDQQGAETPVPPPAASRAEAEAPAEVAERVALGALTAAAQGVAASDLPLDAPLSNGWLEAMLAQEGGLADLKRRIELVAITRALEATGGNITRAAERLGMKRPRLSQIIHATPELGELKREVDQS